MIKNQFNIKISKDLLNKVKLQAMIPARSLTENIIDLINKSMLEDGPENANIFHEN